MADTLLIDETGNWKKWPKAAVLQALQQGDNKLKYISELGKKISDRAYSLLTTCMSIFIIISGWALTQVDKASEMTTLMVIAIAIITMMIVALGLLFVLIYPHDMYTPGSDPDKMLHAPLLQYFSDKQLTPEQQEIYLLLEECEDIQTRIIHNSRINTSRQRMIEYVLRILIAILPVSGIIYFLF